MGALPPVPKYSLGPAWGREAAPGGTRWFGPEHSPLSESPTAEAAPRAPAGLAGPRPRHLCPDTGSGSLPRPTAVSPPGAAHPAGIRPVPLLSAAARRSHGSRAGRVRTGRVHLVPRGWDVWGETTPCGGGVSCGERSPALTGCS